MVPVCQNDDKHAEINVIIKLLSNLARITVLHGKKYKRTAINITVVRVNRLGKLKESKPCRHCVNTIVEFNNTNSHFWIKNVSYSTCNGLMEKSSVKNLDKTVTYVSTGNL